MCAHVFPCAPSPSAAVQQEVKSLWRASIHVTFRPHRERWHFRWRQWAILRNARQLARRVRGFVRIVRPGLRLGGADDPQPGPDAHRLFTAQPTKEKRSLLNFLLSNSTWVRGKLSVEFKEPFDLLIETSRPPNASKRPRERIGRKRGLAELPAFELDLRAGQALSEVQGTL
jgi:hypothetical protein